MKDDMVYVKLARGSITINDTLRDLIRDHPELKYFIENACDMDIVDENDEKIS